LFKVFIIAIADETGQIRKLSSELAQKGFTCLVAPDSEKAVEQFPDRSPDLVLVDMDASPASSELWRLLQKIKAERRLPVIALIAEETVEEFDFTLGIDDFVTKPYNLAEVIARIRHALWRTNNIDNRHLIKCGDLVMDLARCEVRLNGRRIPLTFKEYELLRFLATNRGRVFTREALLNKVWGYDYFGGDRTVDVHIRRLRSKIEDSTHTFIETVRNIGYKFREEA
jgi:DNA-binding response OmpR family regulator